MYAQNYMCGMYPDTCKENLYLRVDSLSHCILQPQRFPAPQHQSERKKSLNKRVVNSHIHSGTFNRWFFYKTQRYTGPYKQRILRSVLYMY